MSNKIVEFLYATEAFKVSPDDRPFWYTSGKIGPFYINTHYLYGGAAAAEALLAKIDLYKGNPVSLTAMLLEETTRNYEACSIYRELCDELVAQIRQNIDLDLVDYISGGERRDWFFSVQAARLLGKKHISIFKDMSMAEGFGEDIIKEPKLIGAHVLHVADLVTEASSYERAWVPAIREMGGHIDWSFVIVDRMQGGTQLLEELEITPYSMVNVDSGFFAEAYTLNLINDRQLRMLLDYEKNPDAAMTSFIKEHPEFMENTLAGAPLYGGEKAAARARLCQEKRFYLTEQ